MKVARVMSVNVGSCTPETSLAKAAWTMWERDCGGLPVISDGRVVGLLTDRDICMAAATKSRACQDIRVAEVVGQNEVAVVGSDDDLEVALDLMRRRQVRRLPVVDGEGSLVGMLSLIDIVRAVEDGPVDEALGADRVVDVLTAISQPATTVAR